MDNIIKIGMGSADSSRRICQPKLAQFEIDKRCSECKDDIMYRSFSIMRCETMYAAIAVVDVVVVA